MASFSPDQFDELPADLARVGAHRAPPRRGRGWIRFAWAALATGLLVVGGLVGLSSFDSHFRLALPNFGGATASASPTPSATPTAEPITNPASVPASLKLSISVLNGSPTDGLQDKAGDAIKAAGWPDPARANSTTRAEKTTVIYYRSAEYEGVARGLAALLGVGVDVQLSDAFLGAPVTIVLGSDYPPK
jgi:hypothetical protein